MENGLDNGPQTSAIVRGRIVSRSKIDNVVDDIANLLEYAKGFPPNN
jgi:hypothetical protein